MSARSEARIDRIDVSREHWLERAKEPRAMGEFGPDAANHSTLAAIGFESGQETVITGQVA